MQFVAQSADKEDTARQPDVKKQGGVRSEHLTNPSAWRAGSTRGVMHMVGSQALARNYGTDNVAADGAGVNAVSASGGAQ
jgi:hypothetical protein